MEKDIDFLTRNIYIPKLKKQSFIKKILNKNLIIIVLIKFIIFFIIFFIYYYLNKNYTNNIYLRNYILSKKSLKSKTDNQFINQLKLILDNEEDIIENELLSKHTTFRIGGPAKYFVIPKTVIQIIQIIKLCNKYKVDYFVLGNGSNLLVSDQGYNGVIIQINEKYFSNLKVKKENENNFIVTVGGGMLMKTLSIEACLLSLTGLEDIIDIPGTVGGGIIMNASFKGSGLKNPLIKVKAITPEGKLIILSKEECGLTHRGSILKIKNYLIIEAIFRLEKGDQMLIQKTMTNNTKKRYERQPMYFGSAGCFFIWDHEKNGSMYEKYKESNLVGYRVGNAMIYTYNIAFIVNLGNASAMEVMRIVKYIEKIMKEKYQIQIKREVIVIGSFNNNEN